MGSLSVVMMKRIYFVISVFLVSAFTALVHAQGGYQVDKIIAKVDNQIILKSELDLAVLQQVSMGELDNHITRCKSLETLMVNKLLLAKAEIDSVTVEDKAIEEQMNRRMAYFVNQIGSEKKLEEYYNKSIDQLKNDLRRQVREQMIAQKYQEKITGKIKSSPGEIKKYFESIPKDSLPFFSKEVVVGQIVKEATVDKTQKLLTKRKLEGFRQSILAGENFCDYTKFSEDLASAKNCGTLGFFKRGELVPEYEAASFNMKPNEISEVIESQFGFHLIQMIERRGNEYNTRHILLKPSSSSIDLGSPVSFMDSLRTVLIRDHEKFSKAAKNFSDDKATKDNGGFFTEQESGSLRMSMDKLEPGIFFAVDTMKAGSISKPIQFTTAEGKQAIKIIYLKEVVPAHIANLKDDYQKITEAASSRKKAEAIDKWFVKAKKDVFIKLDEEYKDCEVLKED